MKIVIIGFSASGKTTFADILSKRLNIDVMHLDTYRFLDNWEQRDKAEFNDIATNFIGKSNYIIEGNYFSIAKERFENPDIVFYFAFNRFKCLYGALKRHKKYKNKSRDEFITNCPDKIDFSFIKWIMLDGRTSKKKKESLAICKRAKDYYIFKNRKQVNKCLKSLGIINS